jgi:hypothetical protein
VIDPFPPPSRHAREHWHAALVGGDDRLLDHLVATDDPAAALVTLEAYVNGTYADPDARPPSRVQSHMDRARRRLGWGGRDFDLQFLRLVRRSGMLSAVLGAGVTMGAGGPSWSALVRGLLEILLGEGVSHFPLVPTPGKPGDVGFIADADGSVRIGAGGWRGTVARPTPPERFSARQESMAREVLAEIERRGDDTDVAVLTAGAQLCHELCGQELFRLVHAAVYRNVEGPSPSHRAIARVARGQRVSGRDVAGWEVIVTYNFDALMTEALDDEQIPNTTFYAEGRDFGEVRHGDEHSGWSQEVLHLHGFTPRSPMRITDVRFVFSASQFDEQKRSPMLEAVSRAVLANPMHVALYIGCSFRDEAMNELLRQTFVRYPARFHYALLPWPHQPRSREPSMDELEREARRYTSFGVRPIWFDSFDELPALIERLH